MRRFSQLVSIALLGLVGLPACSKDPSGPVVALQKFIATHDKAQGGDGAIDKSKPDWKQHLPKPPQVEFVPGAAYVWKLDTSHGVMRFKLLPDVAPMHCSSFAYLTLLGFFDGLSFHRVMHGFMAQGGDPLGTGAGGPGYGMVPEIKPGVRHDHIGVLSTAHSMMPNSDGSQFFIMFASKGSLDGQYAIFGDVLDDDSRKAIQAIDKLGNPADGPPSEPVTLLKATLETP